MREHKTEDMSKAKIHFMVDDPPTRARRTKFEVFMDGALELVADEYG